MSAVTSRPRISGVVLTAAGSSVTTGAALAASLLRSVGSATRAAERLLSAVHDSRTMELRPVSAIRRELHERSTGIVSDARTLSPLDAVKLDAAMRLTGYAVSDPDSLSAPLRALETASSVEQVRDASKVFFSAVEAEHHRTFVNHLVTACCRASQVAGFLAVETRMTAGGTIRIVATSQAGHALVTEIEATAGTDPSLATEVIGLHDGRCTGILDRFDAALEAEGVRAAPPQRKFTGGICNLAAAREFVGRRLRPKQIRQTAAEDTRKPTRRQRRGTERQKQRQLKEHRQ